ncbi:hypothetical protein EJ08DRAFT_653425 [Tothia fuscella]|uniref:Uncharacterized protein n=1 Tax=Tothia fuscella TaxID=1048955 RepID=A0A9P4NHC1_9PEZI|nr:hypothetical protein EJ08DRAFT_653425 [Tothia fuscella]
MKSLSLPSLEQAMGLSPHGFDREYRFVTSWILPPALLASLRLLLSIYVFTTIFFSFGWFSQHWVTWFLKDFTLPEYSFHIKTKAIGYSFSYFTYLSFWGLGFYLLFASIHTFNYARRRMTHLHISWPPVLQILHHALYTTVTCFPLMVTIIFWGSLFNGWSSNTSFYRWHNLSIHGFNSVFALFEILVTRTVPPPLLHLLICCTILSVYLGLAYLTYRTEHFWVYEWLNPKYGAGQIVAHVFGYAGIITGVFAFVWCLIWARGWAVGGRCQGRQEVAPTVRERQEVTTGESTPDLKENVELRTTSSNSYV